MCFINQHQFISLTYLVGVGYNPGPDGRGMEHMQMFFN